MDMKKLIEDFRHFQRERHQRERHKTKFGRKKMLSFTVLLYERRGADQVLHDEQANVTVRVYEDHIHFIIEDERVILALYNANIITYDDGEPDSDEENGVPTETATLIIYREAQNVTLVFGDLTEKRNFITALRNLQRANSSDCRTSTN
jgi:hypothetical protein